jgi:UDP-N-acetylglucosamine diphosphorylase/glucosamine-1-phosphate N-acetyltransferase
MNVVLFDDDCFDSLLPLTHTRPVASLRCGILTMHQRWEFTLKTNCSYKTKAYLQKKFLCNFESDNFFINGNLFHSPALQAAILELNIDECLMYNSTLLAIRLNESGAKIFDFKNINKNVRIIEFANEIVQLKNTWDIFSKNDWAIRHDFALLTEGKISETLSASNQLIGNNIFIEAGAKISCSILNSETGPIYIGRDAEIMEGSMIRGPFALGENAVLKMGSKIYGATTIGDGCKVGGEVNNSVFYANSSKAHDGFVGNAVIGEWCNLGADTNNSNLKNNYEEVKLWSESQQSFVKTGLQFCGLIMGDHSKCGINTMFNTGTVVGVSCNLFGAGFPRNFIPSFSWGGAQGFTEYKLNKVTETANKVFARRHLIFDETEQDVLHFIFKKTIEQRNY